jgi:serine/threonine protein phosphatase PrpC
MMNASFIKQHIKFGTKQIRGISDEDYISSCVNHETDELSNFASFGVYNGHNGKLAAAVAAEYLHKGVMSRFIKVLKATSCISSDEASAYLAPDVITKVLDLY